MNDCNPKDKTENGPPERCERATAEIARRPAACCGSPTAAVAADELPSRSATATAELAALPEGANMGLSCGNPTAIAALKPGEVVLDLGSGGGFDVFLAGQQGGPDRPGHRRGHDARDARQGARATPRSIAADAGWTTSSSAWARSSTCPSPTPAWTW